jgi:myo-inositol-1(or 4)-monophosphatase
LGGTLRYNSTKGEAFGVLATSHGIHAAAVARLADRARTAIIR